MKRIIYPLPDGGVGIVIPAPNCGMTLDQIVAKDVPEGRPHWIIDVADLPADRVFRASWAIRDGRVVQDVEKCRRIAHDRRRLKRAAQFAPLDIEATIPAKAAAAEAKRQAIRDADAALQARLDAAATAEALLAIVKSELA
jgi:hypothetical protein